MTAERYNDKSELKSWGGIYRSYENVSGMLVPFEAEVAWQLETGSFTYAHWFVVAAEYDVPGTFAASKESTQISPVMP